MPDKPDGMLIECDHCGESLFTVYVTPAPRMDLPKRIETQCDYCGMVQNV